MNHPKQRPPPPPPPPPPPLTRASQLLARYDLPTAPVDISLQIRPMAFGGADTVAFLSSVWTRALHVPRQEHPSLHISRHHAAIIPPFYALRLNRPPSPPGTRAADSYLFPIDRGTGIGFTSSPATRAVVCIVPRKLAEHELQKDYEYARVYGYMRKSITFVRSL
ncbi:hypothetical protein CSAL01_04657 [Colletotrichum salicis]|uniref:Uncharacterized protein n=1 Tax=Colletotrichum salicis TaxID=1209931 RepID=A0A135RWW0_9PEZI|nr:hypothetical protein CSAL01_04657 [Colletotrichum salicis]